MKKQPLIRNLILVLLPLLAIVLIVQAQEQPNPGGLTIVGPGQRYTETIPVIDIQAFGFQPAALPTDDSVSHSQFIIQKSQLNQGGGSDPNNPYAVIRKTGPTFMQPGGTAQYEITLANYESITQTYQLTDTLPPQLAYVPDLASDLAYDSTNHTLTWQGELAPGDLNYVIEENSLTLPYLDLATFGAGNLCDDFITNGETCDDVTVTFNLGVNGYTANLYSEVLNQLTVSSNGLIMAPETAASSPFARNQWLPDAATPGFVLAGLWRDVNMGGGDALQNGRFHAAIISGLIAEYDVFYAQWHDAPHTNDPDLTARHAIAIVLNGNSALTGQAFFIYDNISDPGQTVAQGYTIGIGDKLGVRGATYAYAPCCGDPQPSQGYPPTAGTTLHLRPLLFGAANAYHRTFRYAAIVTGQVPETITNTATATSSSNDPALASVWSTHYLYVRRQTFIPFSLFDEVSP